MYSKLPKFFFLASVLVMPVTQLFAGEIEVQIRGKDGDPVANAVVYVEQGSGKKAGLKGSTIVVDQVNKEFVNHVTAVQTGTAVTFPNKDQIRHHVYSFSAAKQFEIPLYKGTPAKPVVFDKPGVVVLGCNIHDWMSAYIYVVDTPWFAVTDKNGTARLMDLPAGNHKLLVWHPRLKGKPEATAQNVESSSQPRKVSATVDLKRAWMARRGPSAGGGGYR